MPSTSYPLATETIPEIVAFIAELVERGHAYEADGDVYFRVGSCRSTARSRASGRTRWRTRTTEPAQGGPARLRALEGERSRARTPRGTRRGARAGRAGTSSARRWRSRLLGPDVRDPRRRARPRLPAPRERARAVAGASGTASPRSGCTTACSASPARRCRSRSATWRRSRRCSTEWGRETLLVFFLTGHWRKPIDYSEETMTAAAARRRSCARPSAARPGRRPKVTGSGSPPRSTTTSTRPRRSRSCTSGGTHELLRRGLDVFGLATLADRPEAPAGDRRARRAPPACPAERDFAESDRLRTEIAAAGWEVRDDVRRLRARAARVTRELVYGRNAVREALRGRREVLELWVSRAGRRGGRAGSAKGRGCRSSRSAS